MDPNDKMKTITHNTYHFMHRVSKLGMHPPRESNQPWVENYTTGSATSLEKHCDGKQTQGDLPAGSSIVTPTKKNEKDKRQKWGREVYYEVMYAFYISLKKTQLETTQKILGMNLNGNKLSNVHRDVMNKKD